MRQWVLGVSVLCLSLSAGIQLASAQASPAGKVATIAQASPQEEKQAIVETYQAIDNALNQGDMKRLGSFMAPEYTSTGVDKTVKNRQQVLQTTTENFRALRQFTSQTQLKRIEVDGQTASVDGVTTFRAIVADPKNPQVSRSIVGEQVFQEVLQRVGQQWQVVTTVTRSENVRAEPQTNQTSSDHNVTEVFLRGIQLVNTCYGAEERRYGNHYEACEQLNQIQALLLTWCSDNNPSACKALGSLNAVESAALLPSLVE